MLFDLNLQIEYHVKKLTIYVINLLKKYIFVYFLRYLKNYFEINKIPKSCTKKYRAF